MSRHRAAGALALALALALAGAANAQTAGDALAAAPVAAPGERFGAPRLLFLPEEREALEFGRQPPPVAVAEPETPAPAEAAEPPDADAPAAPSRLRLDGLFYVGPERWSLWLNGERLDSAGGTRPDIRILAVSPDAVRLSWRPAGAGSSFRVLLRPNQVFDASLGRVAEAGP